MLSNQNNIRDIEVGKSVDKLISIQNKSRAIKLSDNDFRNQYIMASRFEISRLRKLGYVDVTEEELNLKVNEKLSSSKNVEIEKSINALVQKRKKIIFNDMNDFNQYRMAINLEVTKLRKMGHTDVTTELLNSLVDDKIKQEQMADQAIENMTQGVSTESINKQRGYTIMGILGLITCITTIGIIIYGYILFYR